MRRLQDQMPWVGNENLFLPRISSQEEEYDRILALVQQADNMVCKDLPTPSAMGIGHTSADCQHRI